MQSVEQPGSDAPMSDQFDQELPIPQEAALLGGKEVLRAFIVQDDLHVSLANAFEDPGVWGMMLVDIVGLIADMYAAKAGIPRTRAIAEIREGFDREWARPDGAASAGAIR